MSRRTPNLLLNIWNNFTASLKPRKIIGDYKGQDHLGNKYYEIPADPSRGKRRPHRWFKNEDGETGYDRDKPAEWESWLRFRREVPPSEEEVNRNLAIIKLKEKNAALLEEKYGNKSPAIPEKGMDSFPKYEEFYHSDKK